MHDDAPMGPDGIETTTLGSSSSSRLSSPLPPSPPPCFSSPLLSGNLRVPTTTREPALIVHLLNSGASTPPLNTPLPFSILMPLSWPPLQALLTAGLRLQLCVIGLHLGGGIGGYAMCRACGYDEAGSPLPAPPPPSPSPSFSPPLALLLSFTHVPSHPAPRPPLPLPLPSPPPHLLLLPSPFPLLLLFLLQSLPQHLLLIPLLLFHPVLSAVPYYPLPFPLPFILVFLLPLPSPSPPPCPSPGNGHSQCWC